MTALPAHTLVAFNTSTQSENMIHDDTVAQVYGFKGGLVPGVDVYAYMTHPAVAHWGRDWLTRGAAQVRLLKPVYDGEEAQVSAQLDGAAMRLEVVSNDIVCASGEARLPIARAALPHPDDYAVCTPPPYDARPPASFETLAAGQALGTFRLSFDARTEASYLGDIRENLTLYSDDGLMHPGWLLKRANDALKENVLLGPWIHVSSKVQNFAALEGAAELEVRSRVVDAYEHKGHGFVDLDVLVLAIGQGPIAQIDHKAIFSPRKQRA